MPVHLLRYIKGCVIQSIYLRWGNGTADVCVGAAAAATAAVAVAVVAVGVVVAAVGSCTHIWN